MSIYWYGERGIVNTLVLALHEGERVSRWRDFLGAIEWGDGSTLSWLQEIQEVRPLVEVGLAQFGNPDVLLVLDCRTPDGQPRVRLVFVEAKVSVYSAAASSNEEGIGQQGSTTRGFNSSINGQLALRYRFAHAVASWPGEGPIREPSELLEVYRRDPAHGGLSDPFTRPRGLAKRSVLELLRAVGARLISVDSCYFVALTDDTASPFDAAATVERDDYPRLLNGDGSSAWFDARCRVGWIGYSRLQAMALGADFERALRHMEIGGRRSNTAHEQPAGASQEPSSPGTLDAVVGELRIRVLHEFEEVREGKGNLSVTIGGRVRLKVVRRTTDVLVAVHEDELPMPLPGWDSELELHVSNGQRFRGRAIAVGDDRGLAAADAVIEEMVARWPAR